MTHITFGVLLLSQAMLFTPYLFFLQIIIKHVQLEFFASFTISAFTSGTSCSWT
jgi:hypothetical protein